MWSLIQLPFILRELIPVESPVALLACNGWSGSRRHRDYDTLQEEAVRSLCAVRENIETIKTVCNFPYSKWAHEIAGKRITRCGRSREKVLHVRTAEPGPSALTDRRRSVSA